MPRKVFTPGEVLAAADVNEFLQDQAVMTFAGTAARGSAIGTATEGMLTYLADSDTFEFFDGSSFVPLATEGPTVEYLVIAGGAGGSLRASGQGAGGGGAGGYRTNVSGALSGGSVVAELAMPLVAATYPVVVGAGGAGVTADNAAGGNGSFSAFANIVCIGGSRGQNATNTNAVGGSGGGGMEDRTAGSDPVFQQGFKGGNGSGSFSGAAGGGGAGAAGANTTGSSGSAGGDGLASSITGSSVTRAGGGGGGGSSGSGGTGGAGGGGNGSIDNATSGSGTVNTGSGGGGGETGTSGSGGSGIVIFSVPTGTSVSFSGGVTETNSTVGDRQVYIVTATSTTSETVTFA